MSKAKILISILILFTAIRGQAAPKAPDSTGKTEVTTSGFLDTQMYFGHGNLQLRGDGTSMAGESSGFRVYQGAVMLSDEIDRAEILIDIPFRSNATTGSTSNDLELATKEAQAYVKYQYDSGLYWQFGQFDSPYGLEGNDTVDMVFPQFGVLQPFTPNTHTGIMVAYTFLPFYAQFIVGNGNSTSLPASQQSTQFGARLGWNQEPIQASIGAVYTRTNGTYILSSGETPGYKPNILLNAVFQTQVRKVELGIEVNAAESKLGVAQAVSGRKTHDLVYGFLAHALYHYNDKWSAGGRIEYLANDETNEFVRAAQNNSTSNGTTLTGQGGYVQKASLGTRRIMNEELVAKAGVDLFNLNIGVDNPSGGKTLSWVQGSIGLVYDF